MHTWHEVIGEPTFADAILDRITTPIGSRSKGHRCESPRRPRQTRLQTWRTARLPCRPSRRKRPGNDRRSKLLARPRGSFPGCFRRLGRHGSRAVRHVCRRVCLGRLGLSHRWPFEREPIGVVMRSRMASAKVGSPITSCHVCMANSQILAKRIGPGVRPRRRRAARGHCHVNGFYYQLLHLRSEPGSMKSTT